MLYQGSSLQGEYPELSVDYSKVQLSSGKLAPPAGIVAAAASHSGLQLSWNTAGYLGDPLPADMLMVNVYHPVSGFAACYENCASRSDGSVVLATPEEWSGQEVVVWGFFASAKPSGKTKPSERVSATAYAGTVTLL